MLGVGFTIPEISIRAGTSSGAALLLKTESDGLALDFTDNYFAGSGFYGSARIKDTTTPANNYNASPTLEGSSLLSYSSPSVKLTRKSDGVFRYQAHNLYLNSASPANQSITVVNGATYAITITGSVSTTLSGAATGTITAGTTNITASTTTLTFGSTSGSGTVHVRRTPSDSTYLATTSTARYALPYEWDTSGNPLGILVEEARTNLMVQNRFQSGWNVSLLSNTANSGTSIVGTTTAALMSETAGSGPHEIYRAATTVASTTYAYSVYVKQGTTTPASFINMIFGSGGTAQNYIAAVFNISAGTVGETKTGSSSGTIVSTSITNVGNGWYRCTLVGRHGLTDSWIVVGTAPAATGNTWTSYGEINKASGGLTFFAELAQLEAGSFATSPIETFGSTATRAADNISLATSAFPFNSAGPITLYAQLIRRAIIDTNYPRVLNLFNEGLMIGDINSQNLTTKASFQEGSSFITATAGSGTSATGLKIAAAVSSSGAQSIVVNNGSVATGSGVIALTGSLVIGTDRGVGSYINGHISEIMVLPRAMTNTELQTLTS